ncbi:MAG TPA: DUF2062 domain-containing protein [Verrucomicrobiae bacterium]|nr:DUF2062 domain-containing protein [Verrucomicrobiae bacterium]
MKIPGSKLIGKVRDFIVKQYRALLQIRDKPHAIAGGVAVGIFFGFAFVPMKTAFSLLTAWLLRVSKIAAVIAVTAHDILLPVWPFFLRWEYIIGYCALHGQKPPPLRWERHQFRPEKLLVRDTYWHWWRAIHDNLNVSFFAHIIGPMVVGSVIVGLPSAAIFYVVVLRIAKRAQAQNVEKPVGQ